MATEVVQPAAACAHRSDYGELREGGGVPPYLVLVVLATARLPAQAQITFTTAIDLALKNSVKVK